MEKDLQILTEYDLNLSQGLNADAKITKKKKMFSNTRIKYIENEKCPQGPFNPNLSFYSETFKAQGGLHSINFTWILRKSQN